MKFVLLALSLVAPIMIAAPAIAGYPPPLPAMDTLPVGTVLMFDVLPQPIPQGWEACGYIRVEKGPEKEGTKSDHEYLCLQRSK